MANASQIYVGIANDDIIVGFHTLVVGEVRYEAAPERLSRGLARHPVPIMLLARHPVPIMLLARLGVSLKWQGKGIGAGLLCDVVLRTGRNTSINALSGGADHALCNDARHETSTRLR